MILPTTQASTPVVLTRARVSVVVDVTGGTPRVLYWGEALSPAAETDPLLPTIGLSQHGADGLTGQQRYPALLPQQSEGWIGTPGLAGHRAGRAFSTQFDRAGCEVVEEPDGTAVLTVRGTDAAAALELTTTLALDQCGLLRLRAHLSNADEESDYTLESLRMVLPVPGHAAELLDFVGRHLRERTPQRRVFDVGTHLREGRRGRTGSDAAIMMVAGTPGFGFGHGEVWGLHTAWSGNHATFAEHGLSGMRVLGGGEVLLPGEGTLAPGESYSSPWLYASYGVGLDSLADRFHRHLRARPTHPASTRPVVLNTWEAVYFDHDLDSLVHLADLAARVGVERFVLDDGWFRGRRDDTAGLGDWQVDPEVWPHGLRPLAEAVRARGMDFGLWFEPEMVSEDSDLARAHPDWIMAPGERLPLPARHQQVLNLSIPGAYQHVLGCMSEVIEDCGVAYVKWDHNRDLVEAGDRTRGTARVRAQTLAAYALMDELRERHPGLEIEACSSGGGRVDLEALRHTDRVWASDCIDPLERQRIQRWTGLLLPPELVGSHVGAPTAHTTHRTHGLAFRAATALFGHFGIEWDLRDASSDELDELSRWVGIYKSERAVLHSGRTVHGDHGDDNYWVHGVVSGDMRRALFTLVALDTAVAAQPGRVRLLGLDPALRYRVEPIRLSQPALVRTRTGAPHWWDEPVVASGEVLGKVGLQGPMLYPEQALVFRLRAE